MSCKKSQIDSVNQWCCVQCKVRQQTTACPLRNPQLQCDSWENKKSATNWNCYRYQDIKQLDRPRRPIYLYNPRDVGIWRLLFCNAEQKHRVLIRHFIDWFYVLKMKWIQRRWHEPISATLKKLSWAREKNTATNKPLTCVLFLHSTHLYWQQ